MVIFTGSGPLVGLPSLMLYATLAAAVAKRADTGDLNRGWMRPTLNTRGFTNLVRFTNLAGTSSIHPVVCVYSCGHENMFHLIVGNIAVVRRLVPSDKYCGTYCICIEQCK